MSGSIMWVLYIYFNYIIFLVLYSVVRFYVNMRGFLIGVICLLFLFLFILLYHFFEVVFLDHIYYLETNCINFTLGTIELNISLVVDTLSFLFLLLVIIIGFTTNIYLLNYFKNEAEEASFTFWLNSFIASMSLLILSNNFFTLFLGWELIGLTSFFLINFWSTRRATLKSSFKAFSFNLISDMCLLVALVFLFLVFGTTDILYISIFSELLLEVEIEYISYSCLFLLSCASIKSVQLFGHLWLPDSMEAPVPASALIHSATLVSAGIYLLLKFFNIFLFLNYTILIGVIGAITCAYGGVVSATQTDMKKLLAYSTMSHCGFLYITIFFGYFLLTIIYLFLHGIFKAATFYCVGSFVRIYKTQDIRLMGIGHVILPVDTILLIICAFNLGGLPFSIGYIYKSFFFKILLIHTISIWSIGFILVGLLSSFLYVYRIIYYSCYDYLKGHFNITLFYLSKTTTSITLLKSFYTPITYISISILLVFSFSVYYISLYCINTTLVEWGSTIPEVLSSVILVKYYIELYLVYIYIYYFLYSISIFYIIIFELRFKFLKIQTFYTLIYLNTFIVSLNIINI